MRKRFIIGVVTLLLFSGQLVFANDGSLQIDTNLAPSTEKTEISYIE